jgi:hypothetical protein
MLRVRDRSKVNKGGVEGFLILDMLVFECSATSKRRDDSRREEKVEMFERGPASYTFSPSAD